LSSEISEEFIQYMRNRMLMSYYKYGPVAEAYPDKIDALASLQDRLRLYARGDAANGIRPGNTEYLVDAANFCMIEFMRPRHPEAHFLATDDEGSPGRRSLRTGQRDKRKNEDL
jgi:hypothetical protein